MCKKYIKNFVYLIVLLLLNIPAFALNEHLGVLCYHNVIDESVPNKHQQYFPQTISAQTLITHFNWLRNNGYKPVSLQQIMDARNGRQPLPKKAVLLTFDDGYESFYKVIYPLLKAYNYPAVYAIVTDWINTPSNRKISYGSQKLNRSEFVTWRQLREMQASGLVEMASHTNDLHHGIKANPAGSSLPAVIAPAYRNGKYETSTEYKNKLRKDFQQSYDLLKKNVGVAPRAMIWPYGHFTATSVNIAKDVGFDVHMSLIDTKTNVPGNAHLGRLLLDSETSITTIENYLKNKNTDLTIQRSLRIKLDDIYDPNPVKQNKNLDQLIERIHRQGISRVYIQAFSDANHDGIADSLYFPNKYLPVRADLFSRVAWIIQARLGLEPYAWLPISVFDLTNIDQHKMEMVKSVYQDLSLYTKFKGILLSDEKTVDDDESLLKISNEIEKIISPYTLWGNELFKTVGMISAPLNLSAQNKLQFSQRLTRFAERYDFVTVAASPYGHNSDFTGSQAKNWVKNVVKSTTPYIAKDKLAFELQTTDERTGQKVSTNELVDWMKVLQEESKVYNFGYYPDNFQLDQPELKKIRPHFSINRNIGLK
ncbi:poly-beta-1,6-N-acetyl-D-glucosamine N-deacetylase PgaB [Actinobacillus succinogenes]|uniref:Polysaccharide deacetylase n=1 Tax=Actinobacillus succinogenes (strain ATCC 55618 / DSM 22257 / CCUG 43843 / 130Z) TaxID=339671 RepID=A6VMM9_ACTSZ|nr:polysaccharide deacetylase [Actinobacillus succinogenes 130Z]PHI39345.1 poly-beta-1,6-N-acetyl-D-glucosamine N-deacetylase PgaB [Actinobacillus succinogenes]